jgi:protein-glutamine gamma-glutamyltransferase
MIQISDVSININTLEQEWPLSFLQRTILERIAASPITYQYPSLSVLRFEIKLRSNIVSAAKKLNNSGADFTTFKKSRCNPAYWILTEEGGFQLREGAEPARAINDIFENGSRYGFECATAIVIVYYKALLDSVGRRTFNEMFPSILLFDGTYDEKLRLREFSETEYLPGDVLYFKNPDYNPKTPEWQGENVVLLENNRYFAHGIGIKTKREVISSLNKERRPGAEISAYLEDKAVRPDFAYLSRYDKGPGRGGLRMTAGNQFTIAQIGGVTHIRV